MIIPVTQSPSEQWLEEATQISRIFNLDLDWKSRLNQAIPIIRKLVIFDNLVIYRPDQTGQYLTLIYARATGRGRSQGAEITWGEPFARRVAASIHSDRAGHAGAGRQRPGLINQSCLVFLWTQNPPNSVSWLLSGLAAHSSTTSR